MRAGSIGWHDEQEDEERRRIRRAASISLGIHVALFLALVISPGPSTQMIDTIAIELVAGQEIAAPAAPRPSGRSKPPPPAPKPPTPEARPEPAPEPPPPPIAKAPVQVLPEKAPKPDKQVPEKKPKEAAKPEAKPPEKPAKKPPEKDLSYEDAMKSLDEELGEDATDDLLAPAPARPNVRTSTESSGAAESRAGAKIDPELAAWYLETRRLIQSKWVTPSNFNGRGLQTVMELRLSASGALIGEPTVVRTSGDPYFDDNAVRAILSVAPLPPTPKPGRTIFIFSAEE